MPLLHGMQDLKIERCLHAITSPTKSILEIGCGKGTFISSAKYHHPAVDAFGCDIDCEIIRYASDKEKGIHYVCCDALFLPYKDNSFDTIIIIDVLEHIQAVEAVLQEIQRVLRKGGTLYCHVPCEGEYFTLHWFLWKCKLPGYKLKEDICGHIQRFTFGNIIHLMKQSGFRIDSMEYMYHPIGQIQDLFGWFLRDHFLQWIHNTILRILPSDIEHIVKDLFNHLYKQYKDDKKKILIHIPSVFRNMRTDHKSLSKSRFIMSMTIAMIVIIMYGLIRITLISVPCKLLDYASYYESKVFHKSRLALGIDIVCKK